MDHSVVDTILILFGAFTVLIAPMTYLCIMTSIMDEDLIYYKPKPKEDQKKNYDPLVQEYLHFTPPR